MTKKKKKDGMVQRIKIQGLCCTLPVGKQGLGSVMYVFGTLILILQRSDWCFLSGLYWLEGLTTHQLCCDMLLVDSSIHYPVLPTI